MARGNWQKKVETAEARRQQSKQRKQRSDDKRQYKNMAQELLALLGRHQDVLLRAKDRGQPMILHIWTESLSANGSPDLLRDAGISAKQLKARSASIESDDEGANGKKGRGQSNSTNEKPSKKKGHSRKHEVAVDSTELSLQQTDDPVLCKPHFFAGKCRLHGQKGGGCRLLHYTMPQYKTLHNVCSAGAKSKVLQGNQLPYAEAALVPEEDLDAMEMVYYFSHALLLQNNSEDLISKNLTDALVENHLGLATIVYAALDGVLIFDRNREGVILSDRDFLISALGDESAALRSLSKCDEEDVEIAKDLFFLPGPVLEYILTFLPDSAVAVASQVCKSWHFEIGQNSPNLWRHLLERREWPLPELNGNQGVSVPKEDAQNSAHRLFRGAFLRHYAVLRDVTALQSAVSAVDTKRVVAEKEMAYQDFSTRKGAPAHSNRCRSVHVWGPNRILASYTDDSSLRLFATVAKVGGKELLCRQLVCQRIDPYRHTKRRTCRLFAVDVDEEAIGSLCHVMADGVDAEAYILVVLRREDFLLGESAEVKPKVIDIGESVLNYLLSCEEVDDRLLQMIDFLDDGGYIGDVEVDASYSTIACGHGRFMVEVSVSIPPLDEDDRVGALHLIARKLVLFSSGVGAIVWIGDSHPITHEPRPRSHHFMLTCLRKPHQGASRPSCDFAVYCAGSLVDPVIMVGEIDPMGHVISAQHLDGPEAACVAIQEEGWAMIPTQFQSLLVTPADIIMANTSYKTEGGDTTRTTYKSFISFLPRYKSAGDEDYSNILLTGNLHIVSLSSFRDQHLVALCQCHDMDDMGIHSDVPINANGLFNLVARISVIAVIIHVPTRREIGRMPILDDSTDVPQIPHKCEDTVGVGVSWKGLIMTGGDVRALAEAAKVFVIDESRTPSKSPKVKKKQGLNKLGKKDKGMRRKYR